MDIRNFFTVKTKGNEKSDTKAATEKGKKRPKPVVLSSDSEDDVVQNRKTAKPVKKPSKAMMSDSDDDFAPKAKKKTAKGKEETAVSMKEVDPKDFFAKTSKPKTSEKACVKKPEEKKRKVPDEELHDDPDFSAMLKSNAEETAKPSPRKKAKKDEFSPTKIKEEQNMGSGPEKATISSPLVAKKNGSRVSPKTMASDKKKVTNGHAKKADLPNSNVRKSEVSSPVKPKATCPAKPKTGPIVEPSKAVTAIGKAEEISLDSQLWVDRYKPTSLKSIIGQQGDKSNMNKLITWLRNWPKNNIFNNGKRVPKPPPFASHSDDGSWAKAALLSGPPGVGKTTTAYLVAKELGLDIMELNASDTRSKKMLDSCLSDALNNTSLSKTSKNRVLLMDEVDGMAGNEDRGGMAELIQLLKNSKVPVICMCNDRNHQKIRSLANHCFDLRFQRPRAEQIKAAMMSICFKEKIKVDPASLMELIVGCNQDIRQVLHHLSMLKAKTEKVTVDGAKKEAEASKKTSIKIGPWDVTRKVFSSSDHKGMTLNDKSDLFFHDYSLGPLFVQENYLLSVPDAAKFNKKRTMILTSRAADSIAYGDLIERTIRSQNAWSLLPTEAVFASVIPGEYMAGHVAGQIQFPQWLGKYSRQNKFDRIYQELQVHTRLSAGLSKSSLNQDFAQHLRNAIIMPMKTSGSDGVADSVKAMEFYSLMREDLDNLLEVTAWPDKADPMKGIESKVKAAFTRAYNKDVVLPYAKVSTVTKKVKVDAAPPSLGIDEEEDDDEEDEKDDSIAGDAMIKAKVKRAPAKKNQAAEKKPTPEKKGKGRGKKAK